MKTFACAILTLVVLLAAVIYNGALFSRITGEILECIDKASDDASDGSERYIAVSEIRRILDDDSFVLSLSVSHDEICALSAFVSDAENQIHGDEGQYLSALDKLRTEIKRMRMSECICLDGIF